MAGIEIVCYDCSRQNIELGEIWMSNKEIIQGLYRSFAAGDIQAVTAVFADNIAWTEADGFPLAGTYIGPQAVVENVFMRLGEFSDNWGVAVDRYVADGDTVVADGRYTWNHKETGEPCAVRMAHVWTLADGKAVAFLQHVDSAKVRELID
jgi:ketosteroid isomerase-like protein